jgi:hypothetical protein
MKVKELICAVRTHLTEDERIKLDDCVKAEAADEMTIARYLRRALHHYWLTTPDIQGSR